MLQAFAVDGIEYVNASTLQKWFKLDRLGNIHDEDKARRFDATLIAMIGRGELRARVQPDPPGQSRMAEEKRAFNALIEDDVRTS